MSTAQEMRSLINLLENEGEFNLETAQHIVSEYIDDVYDIDASELAHSGKFGGIAWTLADDDGGEGETVTIEAEDSPYGVSLTVTPSNPARQEITLATKECETAQEFTAALEQALAQH